MTEKHWIKMKDCVRNLVENNLKVRIKRKTIRTKIAVKLAAINKVYFYKTVHFTRSVDG